MLPNCTETTSQLTFAFLFVVFLFFSEITCPALSKVGVGSYAPAECDDQAMDFDRICELRCPGGYQIYPGAQDEYTYDRKCLLTGQWDGEQKSCKGIELIYPQRNLLFFFMYALMSVL